LPLPVDCCEDEKGPGDEGWFAAGKGPCACIGSDIAMQSTPATTDLQAFMVPPAGQPDAGQTRYIVPNEDT
jgi:hypothetical protein